MIEIKNLTRTYRGGVVALREINLEIGVGMFGLVGPNGAGKTTLMRILAGLMHPTGGTVHIFGNDLGTMQGKMAAKALLGYLPQELGLYPNLTGREFLDYIAILKGITEGTLRKRQVQEVLGLVKLEEVAGKKLKTYSGGMKRRMGIAQALLGYPRLIIVDEPTVGLDPEERVRLRNLLGEMARERTVILSSHIIEDISSSCRDLAILSEGQVIFHGTPRDLITAARGHVWNIVNEDGERPNGGLALVSTLQLEEGTQFRVVGEPDSRYCPTPAEPSLEDGYIWLMRHSRETVNL